MAENIEKRWYVLRAISGKEAKVKEILDSAIKNGSLGRRLFQVLIPTENVYTTRAGKKVLKERVLYSGYVFIECELTPEVEYELRNTTNVIDFLRGRAMDSKPQPLTPQEVKRMLGQADELQNASIAESEFLVGEPVKVIFGPFNGFAGTVTDVNKEKKKLKVEVKIFGRPTELELESTQVERV